VKQRKTRASPHDGESEPIVWIFDTAREVKFVMNTRNGYASALFADVKEDSKVVYRSDEGKTSIARIERVGLLSLLPSNKLDHVNKEPDDVKRRLIDYAKHHHHPRFGCMDNDLVQEMESGDYNWWEILVLTGLKYARRQVNCFLPHGMRMRRRVMSHPLAAGKSVVELPGWRFGKAERERLSHWYLLGMPKGSLGDQSIEEALGPLMKRHWVD
jgi:hypothetical protein